ncbi:response regulator transcription factor [Agaribacterium haliotis]|uniref:response regulator transcription factor n=1 Tax=Agaribacterium haliotis TaxID=2013869 RepID=UPI000BB584E2|nr:response regulator transcription factor [Agaribacterium haliotis]
MPAKILIIEDQADIGALISLNLQNLDYELEHCMSGAEGYRRAAGQGYSAIVLDVMLPDMSGLDICRTLRQQGNTTPILMLTAKKSEADRVEGLELGADDYLTKPFSVRELQARVKALIRRASLANDSNRPELESMPLRFSALLIDIDRRIVSYEGKTLKLTSKEFDLLLYMASYPGKVFTREQLLNAVWGYQHNGFEHTVNSHINRLRNKFSHAGASLAYIETVWGVGYKFSELEQAS